MDVVTATNPRRYLAITNALAEDARRCIPEIMNASTGVDQFWARTFVRSFFALVEACTYELRLVVREAVSKGALSVSEGERALLSESSFDVNAEGGVYERSRFIPIERNVRFVHTLLERLFGPVATLPVSDYRYAHFKNAVRIRNRITHPKGPDEVMLSPEDVERTLLAGKWYADVQAALTGRWSELTDEWLAEANSVEL